ncbi:MAG: ATP-grasp domain-containing protein [Deltaproteobacteria bacterium]|nr:ATP-grasp domain-containing protein [Deltaproteobacteria bacterium]
MSRVLEHIGKQILHGNGIAVPSFFVAAGKTEADQAGDNLGYPVVIKALVPVGKRGKAGAVRFAENRGELEKISEEMLSMSVRNFPVEKLLVEKKIDIAQELYVSITIDSSNQMPVIIASTSGGIDIEEIAKQDPSRISKRHVNILEGLHQYQAKEIWSDLGLKERPLQAATETLWKLYQVFRRYDATVLEVNPLAITTEGKTVAAAVLMGVDDDALYRQPELSDKVEIGSDRAWRPLTQREKDMVAVDRAEPYRGTARYTEMDGGDIGFFCGGGGGSLLVYDMLLQYGGKPANYTEFGGNPTDTKVYGLAKGILSKPGVKGFLLDANITNNTQTDLVAKGIIKAVQDLGIDVKKFPIVMRLAGVNEPKARELFQEAGIEYHGDDITMEDAARLIAEKMKNQS